LPNLENVQKGEVGRICPQAFPAWYAAIRPLQSGNETLENLARTDPASFIPPPDPRENEDCLFLDVVVPVKIFNHTTTKTKYAGAPVVIWFYGGGFTFTDKDGSPAGLIKRSQERAVYTEGIIYVKFNYRVSLTALD
jgi:carboxylesterase type B